MKNLRLLLYNISVALSALLVSSALEARTVKGKVTCGKERLSDVIVTDGRKFALTGRNGTFRMEIDDDAQFVYIVTPSGYVADWSCGVPQFYQNAAETEYFHFDLSRTGESGQYNIIAVGDPQPYTDEQAEEITGAPLDDICATVASLEGSVVGIVLGDICFDNFPLMKVWKNEVVRTGIPFYTVPGNHDHDWNVKGSDFLAGYAYRENFGPENHAFRIGDDLVIMLDDIIYEGGHPRYVEGYTEEVLSWVEGLMEYIPDDTDIYVAQHSPLNGRSGSGYIVNGDRLLEILDGHDVTFLSGHNHVNYNYEYAPGILEHNIAAFCGTWGDAYHCKDGTPRGYKVFTRASGGLSWYYKSIGWDKDYQYQVFRPGECEVNPDCVVVNLWDYDPSWTIEWQEDGKSMGKMIQVEELNPLHKAEIEETFRRRKTDITGWKRTIKARHYFAARPSEGASRITITIRSRFGKLWREEITL